MKLRRRLQKFRRLLIGNELSFPLYCAVLISLFIHLCLYVFTYEEPKKVNQEPQIEVTLIPQQQLELFDQQKGQREALEKVLRKQRVDQWMEVWKAQVAKEAAEEDKKHLSEKKSIHLAVKVTKSKEGILDSKQSLEQIQGVAQDKVVADLQEITSADIIVKGGCCWKADLSIFKTEYEMNKWIFSTGGFIRVTGVYNKTIEIYNSNYDYRLVDTVAHRQHTRWIDAPTSRDTRRFLRTLDAYRKADVVRIYTYWYREDRAPLFKCMNQLVEKGATGALFKIGRNGEVTIKKVYVKNG